MRTTIRIDDELLSEAKRVAIGNGTTLSAVIEDALRRAFVSRSDTVHRERVRLPTVSGQGLHPGVDLNDSASLLDLMEEFSDTP